MSIEKTHRNNALFEAYGLLLTAKQQEIYESTYQEDLSLSEIAENLAISRAAVYDTLKRTQSTLDAYEEKLHILQKEQAREQLYQELLALQKDTVQKIVERLRELDV